MGLFNCRFEIGGEFGGSVICCFDARQRKVAVWELFAGKEATGRQRADCSWLLWMVTVRA
jgi:hypothetical protein